ncbi:MAG: glycerophosphodiester phosphodiesterase [Zetaproteobacteria bacterium]|nr:MAG: glycerophosphodiester phosphodiesterase [Zetaproteobacteria bacterium]
MTLLVAHRGDQERAPENTLDAFHRAWAQGAAFVECDVQFTRDFEPVLLHDNRLRRLCGRPDLCAIRLDYEGLVRACKPHFALLRLSGFAHWLAVNEGMTAFVEIKPTVLRQRSAEEVAARVLQVVGSGAQRKIVWISKSGEILDALARRTLAPLGWVASGKVPPKAPVRYVFLPWRMRKEAGRFQKQGVEVAVYTINESERARALAAQGIDLIETDFYGRMRRETGLV